MLIPIGHENMTVRRWPIVTFALIIINVLAFLATNSTIDKEGPDLEKLRVDILLLAAMHPDLEMPPEVTPMIEDFHQKHPEEWDKIHKQEHALIDEFDAEIRLLDDDEKLQEKMDAMAQEYARATEEFVINKYGFVPANPKPASYLTANFLHGGWLHLIGNMWFLWLAGFVLEDAWGRLTYSIFYIIAGVAALQFHSWTNSGSLIPTIGASGAVAALMGAFLVRFPKIKIEMLWVYFLFRTRRFKASAYWLLSLWLLTEVFYGTLFGEATGVAHWAHIGGFLFGAVAALVIRYSGIERTVNAAIEQKVTWTCDPEITQAQAYIDQKQVDKAAAILQKLTEAKPMSFDAWNLLREIYWQKQDYPAYLDATLKSCESHMKAHDDAAAWSDYEAYMNGGGKQLPAGTHFDLCHILENQGNYEAVVHEYEKLAADHPSERQGLMALLAAGRICLKKLNRPHDALKFYEAAKISPIPHLDLEQTIQSAIHEAKTAVSFMGANAGGSGLMQQASRT
jgi:membrane associated rhomboid family serine protease